jgi:hypothetical protein
MRCKQLGKTGIDVSEYGLGSWAMGRGAYGVADGPGADVQRGGPTVKSGADRAPAGGASESQNRSGTESPSSIISPPLRQKAYTAGKTRTLNCPKMDVINDC